MSEVVKKEERKELTRFRPATDILEREDGFHIFMDMPGVSKEDMSIDLEEDELTVTGRSIQCPVPGEKFVEMQFGGCEYIRSVSISDIVDRERIKASVENGVLELFLPKLEKVQPKRISIEAQ
ncbi:Hsp20/alpha crystallin family protein [Pseudodesulfovibrio thermohalotolerans]|uniref:Hsp20/alpha crystallin family protein n=1 Tax=Pseudodesulfovibrio thermohalotolerans TaxID=2880651 RepID=UPI0022BA05CE|nr:Hsp20/alpha crystallin family protein [Pseudodesulfovibrio thermohalotolerans]WFS62410.1 Hsp20/alpha crystallin family protein [Pseudodesulfovibrio thermohalotolerans]